MRERRLTKRAVGSCLGFTVAALLGSAGVLFADGFRGLDWGTDRAAIRAAETLPLHHDYDHEVAYWDFELAGVPAGLVYELENGRLTRARYVSRRSTSDPVQELADYHALKRHFTAELGPGTEHWIHPDERPGPPPEGSLDAIRAGRATLVTDWHLDDATARLLIAGRDGEVKTVRVIFEPRE